MIGGDPFDPFNHMRRQMPEMDRMMADPFNMMNRMMNQMVGSALGHQPMIGFNPMHQINGNRRDPMEMDIFGGLGGFGFGGGLMEMAANSPNSMMFSQSTMITMNPDGTQRVVSNSTRKAGDVKETRHAVRDGDNEKVAVGHHIGDRAHYIEKKRDKDGRFRQNHKFVNLDQGEADEFNSEFKTRAHRNIGGIFGGGHYTPDHRAIESGGRTQHSHPRSTEPRQSGSSAPIITVPSDDEDEEIQEIRTNRPSRHNPYLRTGAPTSGPQIREISDEEADMEQSKRRKGMFGKFFGPNDK